MLMRFEVLNITLITNIVFVMISLLLNNFVWSENVIKIIPGASKYDSKNPFSVTRFFDTTYFPIIPNQNMTWSNEDEMTHHLFIINNKQTPEIKIDSGLMTPKKSFSVMLNKSGVYNYSSTTYPYMKGYILVDDKTISKKNIAINNKKEIQISYIDNNTDNKDGKNLLLLIFTDTQTNKNSEHIDYSLIIKDSNENIIHKQSMHSLWGTELISFKIDTKESYNKYPLKVKVMINGIFFQPVTPDTVEFDITK